jgi:hypothetical protein
VFRLQRSKAQKTPSQGSFSGSTATTNRSPQCTKRTSSSRTNQRPQPRSTRQTSSKSHVLWIKKAPLPTIWTIAIGTAIGSLTHTCRGTAIRITDSTSYCTKSTLSRSRYWIKDRRNPTRTSNNSHRVRQETRCLLHSWEKRNSPSLTPNTRNNSQTTQSQPSGLSLSLRKMTNKKPYR